MSKIQVIAHLTEETAVQLSGPKAERIAYSQAERWVGYTRALQVLNQLDQLVGYPKSGRMPCFLIVGRSGNGKTRILERFIERHPVQMTETGGPIIPILRVEMPDTPDESEFWGTLLWTLGISHREKDPASIKKRQAKIAMTYAQVRLLVIDEFNNLSTAPRKTADYLLAAIKGLSNELRISIVAAGTPASIHVINSDPQMKSRFEPLVLNRWKLDEEYLRFLTSYERILPLASPSGLASRALATTLYGMSGEVLVNTVKLLKAAATHAIESGTEQITVDLLKELDWVRPGDWQNAERDA